MKLYLIIIFIIAIGSALRSEDEKYINAMKKNLSKIDTASSVNSFIEIANGFERIALAEENEWLPYYYVAHLYIIASFIDTTKERKDIFLDKADIFINAADSLQPDESEIYTLMGMIAQARLQIDPMNRWMKYGAEADRNFKKAVEIDSLNPRPDYLVGVGLYYTPEQFGGGLEAAKPFLENSLRKFNNFKPDNELMPGWGKEMVENLLKQIEEKSE